MSWFETLLERKAFTLASQKLSSLYPGNTEFDYTLQLMSYPQIDKEHFTFHVWWNRNSPVPEDVSSIRVPLYAVMESLHGFDSHQGRTSISRKSKY